MLNDPLNTLRVATTARQTMGSQHLGIALTLTLLMSTLALSQQASAEIYKSVDKNGKVSFTDKPSKKTEEIKLKSANSIPSVKTPEKPRTEEEDEGDKETTYTAISITSPAHDSAIEHGPGDFTVQVKTSPALDKKHAIQLIMDGKPWGAPAKKPSISVTNADRGTHTLQAKIVNDKKKVLKSSSLTTVHVLRPSVLYPGYR